MVFFPCLSSSPYLAAPSHRLPSTLLVISSIPPLAFHFITAFFPDHLISSTFALFSSISLWLCRLSPLFFCDSEWEMGVSLLMLVTVKSYLLTAALETGVAAEHMKYSLSTLLKTIFGNYTYVKVKGQLDFRFSHNIRYMAQQKKSRFHLFQRTWKWGFQSFFQQRIKVKPYGKSFTIGD